METAQAAALEPVAPPARLAVERADFPLPVRGHTTRCWWPRSRRTPAASPGWRTTRSDGRSNAPALRGNPDRWINYGIDHPTPCQVAAFAPLGGAKYKGKVDSHPYSVAALPGGAWVVADAAGNDLLRVDGKGRISVLSVLPRQPFRITAAGAAGLGLPDCVIGAVYNFEAVPTDVEVAPGGKLIVSLLPGGPEDPSLGARGSVVSVDPRTGWASRLGTGFAGATNLALGDHGRIFVSELFAGRISVIDHGRVRPYVQLAGPLGLTYTHGTLFAGTAGPTDAEGNPTGPGTLVAIR